MVQVGDKAPDFAILDQDEKKVSVKDYSGKWLVLYFYPKDNTPGCTVEAIEFTKAKGEFKDLGCEIVGVSKDTTAKHCKFISKRSLDIRLLSDLDGAVIDSYGVWRPKKFMGREFLGIVRSTFLIDPKGIIRHVWDPVSVKGHVAEVLDTVKELSSDFIS